MDGSIFFTAYFLGMILVAVATCYWEVRLSREEEWWKGLILPLFAVMIGSIANILAIILLVIYGVNRRKMKKKNELEQMKIKDL
ncbi:MAG: hypothetical protein ACI4AO_02895 [Anaerotignum sp.]